MATAIGPARQRLGGTFVAFATALAVTACSSPAAAQPGTPSPRDRIFVTEESASRDSHRPRRLTESTSVVFVSDDRCIDAPGCDAVSAFGLPVPQLLLRGPHLSCSPGRLAGSEDLSIVVAQPANGTSNSLQISTRTGPDVSDWQADLVESRSAVLMIGGGLALSPDGSEVIVAVSDSGRPHSLSFWPPYSVRKYALSEIASGALGPERGRWTVGEGIPYEVLVTQDGHLAHVVTNRGDVITLAVDSMAQVAPPIEMDRPPYSLALVGSLHATLSPEEDLLVTNLVDDGEIVVADLERRTAKSVLLPSAHQTNWVGGVAFNHGPANHGLLAVHRQTQIDVYRVAPPDNVSRVGFAPIQAPNRQPTAHTIFAAIEWSESGSQIIAATDSRRGFTVLDVLDGGSTIVERGALTPCSALTREFQNMPNDVITANHWAAPTPTATASPSVTPTTTPSRVTPTSTTHTPTATLPIPTSTPHASASATASDSATPSPPATSAPTPQPSSTIRSPKPLLLPLLLSESCPPKGLFSDIVLVIDASASMRDLAADRRRKIDVALESTRVFLDGLRLRPGEDRAAIVAFNERAETLVHLTSDRGRLDLGLSRIRIAEFSRVDLGVERAMVELITQGRLGQVQAMVVLSDGLANPVPGDQAIAAARRAQLEDITVYVVGMGPSMDERVLRQMASGAARYFPAPDPLHIRSIYQDLTKHVPCPPEAYWGRR